MYRLSTPRKFTSAKSRTAGRLDSTVFLAGGAPKLVLNKSEDLATFARDGNPSTSVTVPELMQGIRLNAVL